MAQECSDSDREIDISVVAGELGNILTRYKYWLAIVPVFFVLLGGVFVKMADPEWESSVILQIGSKTYGEKHETMALEPVDNVIARVGTSEFQNSVLAASNIPPDSKDARLYRGYIRATQIKTTNLVVIKIRGLSKVKSLNLALATAKKIQDLHAALLSPHLQDITSQVENLDKIISGIHQMAGKSRQDPLTGIVAAYCVTELQQRRASAIGQLNDAANSPTSVMGSDVSSAPVSPNKFVIVTLFLVLGITLGLGVPTFLAVIRTAKNAGGAGSVKKQ